MLNAHESKRKEKIISIENEHGSITPKEIKDIILKSLDSDKAENILCVPLSEGSALADYMVIASGTSSRHVSALAQRLKECLHSYNIRDIVTEGISQSDWVVVDAGDVIIHLFRPEVREFYNIEKMWCHPPTTNGIDNTQIQA